ncbi:MAG TPA: DNA polymerase III subunit beta [Eubacterium sp.]|nr:DNA polymerase III subunit beta [Eubacterium sp.]
MKITFSKNELINSINISLKAVSSKTTMKILECILIEANDNVVFTTNDNDIAIKTIVGGDIIINEPGTVAVDAKMFSEAIKKMPDSEIIVMYDNDKLEIRCDNCNYSIPAFNGDDYVRMKDIEETEYISISQFALKEIIRQTIFSISNNENSKMMSGEYFEVENNRLKVVALDGHRIALRNIELAKSYGSIKAIVPGKSLNELSKILNDDHDKIVDIYFTSNLVVFKFDDTVFSSRLIEGEYYKINQMISNNYETKIKINRKDFFDSIDRASILARDGDKKPVILNITDGDMEVIIKSTLGNMNGKVDIEKTGKDIMIGFNPSYLMDILKVIDDEYVDCYMVNSRFPCIIKNEDESYIYLVLPINFVV